MILLKITTGFVIQKFDTDRQDWVDQTFIASDEVEYETENGDPVNVTDFLDRVISSKEPYLPFQMIQP